MIVKAYLIYWGRWHFGLRIPPWHWFLDLPFWLQCALYFSFWFAVLYLASAAVGWLVLRFATGLERR